MKSKSVLAPATASVAIGALGLSAAVQAAQAPAAAADSALEEIIVTAQFRNENGIGPCDPIRLPSLLLKLGVMVMFKPLSDRFSGMAIKNGNMRCMLVNSNHRISKQNFTIAHELYHLFIQTDFTSEISETGRFDKSDKNEYNADCFAAYLLMPEEGVLTLIPENELSAKNKLTLPTIVKIDQYFACSRTSVLFRLREIGLIDYTRYSPMLENVKQSALMLGYDGDLYANGNHHLTITNYGPKAKDLYDKEIISESHFISLMNDIGIDITSITNESGHE